MADILQKKEKLEENIKYYLPTLKTIFNNSSIDLFQEPSIIQATLDYIESIKALNFSHALESNILQATGKQYLTSVLNGLSQIEDHLKNVEVGVLKLERLRNGKTSYLDKQLPEFITRLSSAIEKHDTLANFVDYLRVERDIEREGLSLVLEQHSKTGSEYKNLSAAYEYLFCSSLIKKASSQFPHFQRSIGFRFDELRKRFKEVDSKLLESYRKALISKLIDSTVDAGVQRGKPSELTHLGLIRHEISKEKKHIPIRELMKRAGIAIKQMKPCFMMSPLSVAQFLPHGSIDFDLVVMDEASQLRPEEALGAVIRAKQIVIVGDPKQLPPTNFFIFSDNFESEDDNADLDYDQESILDLAIKSFNPARRLKWHYRSKHESLIAFSNTEFYENELILFPSPYQSNKEFGISYIIAHGVYDKRRNLIEAELVAKEAANFMALAPQKSLGIIAINKEQCDLITELIENLTKHDPIIENYRIEWDKTLEPFIIKNLENVQGDERDVIFVSTVYGKDPAGNFHQRFGPINGTAGHRRLNVLFTRAKHQIKIFSSIDPEMIKIDTQSSNGIKAFKGFLEYAKTGKLNIFSPIQTGREPGSDFEIFVMKQLSSRGYLVEPQVGVAGYFVDIGVKHPKFPDKYILGIECDGATYHSAKSARDRDKTRQEILENLGWKIHRIWSTDWFNNSSREIDRLLSALPPIY